jgi:hypothetical protein
MKDLFKSLLDITLWLVVLGIPGSILSIWFIIPAILRSEYYDYKAPEAMQMIMSIL